MMKDFKMTSADHILGDASSLGLPHHYRGKVRDTFTLPDDRMVFVTTDRLSAFDRNITAVPFKGEVLNRIARFMFENTSDIVPNHVLSYPDPNVMIVQKLDMLPVEVVVRRYMTGSTKTSIWTKYQNGERSMYGHDFPDGMVKNQELPKTILTPTTKGESDDPISGAEIVSSGLVPAERWEKVADIALKLFARGQEIAAKQGLILVDTKYEFGLDKQGNVVLADEIHTPDSSRYWVAKTYAERFEKGEDPEGLDKEFVRAWLVKNMEDPYKSAIPEISGETLKGFSERYIRLFETLTGETFAASAPTTPVLSRIKGNLAAHVGEPGLKIAANI